MYPADSATQDAVPDFHNCILRASVLESRDEMALVEDVDDDDAVLGKVFR